MVEENEPNPAEKQLQENTLLKELFQMTPPIAPDNSPSESEPTQNFVVPSHLREAVSEMKEDYPDVSEEDLANRLSYY